MKLTQIVFRTVALSLLLTGVVAQAQITGTVTDKTTGKPAVGDTVVLVDVQTGMGEVAKTTTDAGGHYKLTKPGHSNYLVRAIHQGAPYFIGAPEGNAPGDISVYDVTAKVPGVFVEADVLEFEAANGQLQVTERYFVHNPSQPPTTQWSKQSFQIVLPQEAVVEGAGAQRPGGLPTSINLDADGPKGHYAFNFPIQPEHALRDQLPRALQWRHIHFQAAGAAAHAKHWRAVAQEHDLFVENGIGLQIRSSGPYHPDIRGQERSSRQGSRIYHFGHGIDSPRGAGRASWPATGSRRSRIGARWRPGRPNRHA